jgi:dinuclear metal center YbgI/SA1388 family protein
MRLKELVDFLESKAPLSYQESYDNSGLIVGDLHREIKKAVVSLDCTEEVIDEAIRQKADVVISHHPIVFSGLKKITGKTYIERVVIKAIKHDIAIYAIHTNLDNVSDGVNAKIAEKLGLKRLNILAPKDGTLNKLIVFCPKGHTEKVREALFEAGAGHIGNYSECSFNTEGLGTFKAGEDTQPYVGEKGKQHREEEVKIETVFPAFLKHKLLDVLFKAHPYEEVAYDIIPLSNSHSQVGSGLTGELEKEMSEEDFLWLIKDQMGCKVIRHTRLRGKSIKKVAVCGGAGSFLLKDAIASGSDIFITADYKYHQFFDAEDKIVVADVGHYESEQFTQELILEIIQKKFPTFALYLTKINTNPVNYLI